MANFFPGSLQRPGSLISPRQGVRRQSIFDRIPGEVNQFIQMVSELGKDEKPDKCIHFFLKNFEKMDDQKLQSYNLISEVSRVSRHIYSHFDDYVKDIKTIKIVYQFLLSIMRIYSSSPRFDQSLFKIIVRTAQSNDESILNLSVPFIQNCFSKPDFLKYAFCGIQLAVVWRNIFIKHEQTCSVLGPICVQSASNYTINELSTLEEFCQKVLEDFDNNTLLPTWAPFSLLFLGYIIQTINTGDFLPSILQGVREMALQLNSFQFLGPFITAPTNDPPAIWAAIDSICADPDLPIASLISCMIAIHNTKISPSPEVFSFNSFIPRMNEMNDSNQKMLFEIISNSFTETKADFFCYVMPLSQSGINTKYLESISQGVVWGDELIELIITKFFIETDLEELRLCLTSDEHVFNIAADFLDQLPVHSPNSLKLFEIFSSLMNEPESDLTSLFATILLKSHPSSYMQGLIKQIREGTINDDFYGLYTSICLKVDGFTDAFLKEKGIDLLPILCETSTGVDFLTALVVDGPINEIDDYIYEHFNELAISKLNREQLIKIMNGIPKDCEYTGYIRIPSLCAFIDNVPLNTPIDQYFFGSIAAQKYLKPRIEDIRKFSPRYLTNDLVKELSIDPMIFTILTDQSVNHFDLFQFDPFSRNCFGTIQRSTSFSFWFDILHVYNRSVLATFPGGSLMIESNGYITFASKTIYVTQKQWHLFTLVTIEKSDQLFVVGYLDKQRLGENLAGKNMIITFGTDNSELNEASWLLGPYLYMASTPSDQNQISRLVDFGPQHASHKKMVQMNGIRYVPYRGILKFIHLYGGASYLFNLLLEADTQEHFIGLLQSTFNLHRLGCYSNVHFYNSLRYIFRRKIEFFNPTVQAMLKNDLEVSNQFDWNGFIMSINDFKILTSPHLNYKIVLSVLQQHGVYKEVLDLFHTALDSYIFYNYNDETKNNIIQILNRYIQSQPNLIKKLMVALISLPFYDDCEIHSDLLDNRVVDKQSNLFTIATKNEQLFSSQLSCSDAFAIVTLVGNGLSIDVLHFISMICITSPDYFDISSLKQSIPYLFIHVQNEKLWISLFQFMYGKQGRKFEDFLLFDILRPGVLPFLIDLLTHLIPFEIQNYIPESLSFRLIHFLYSSFMSQNIKLSGLVANIQNLCSLGYGERTPMPYPFQTGKKLSAVRRASRPRVYKVNVDEYGDHVTSSYTFKQLIELDSTLYDDLAAFFEIPHNQVKLDQFFEINIPRIDDPDDFTQICSTPIAELVALIAAKTLSEMGADFSSFKKFLAPLLIFGSDVIPKVAIEMHKKIVLAVLNENDKLSNDCLTYLFEFLTHRIIEGWWNGDVVNLFTKGIKCFTTYSKVLPHFVIASLSQVQSNVDDLIEMGISIIESSVFSSLLTNSKDSFIQSFLCVFVNANLIESAKSHSFFDKLSKAISDQSSHTAFNSNNLTGLLHNNPYTSIYHDYYQEIVQATSTNSGIVAAERTDITRKIREMKIITFLRTVIKQSTTARKAFRFEFFTRLNISTYRLERSINLLFKVQSLNHYSSTLPSAFSKASISSPLSVPRKLIPRLFDYEASYRQTKTAITVPRSIHKPSQRDSGDPTSNLPEIAKDFKNPKCLEGWDLPPRTNINVSSLFKRRFHASCNPFICNILFSPEILPCVAVYSNVTIPTNNTSTNPFIIGGMVQDVHQQLYQIDCKSSNYGATYNYFNVPTLHILLNAKISQNGSVILLDDIQLCHHPIIENAIHDCYGESSLFLGHAVLNIPLSLITFKAPRTYVYKPQALDICTAYGCHLTLILVQSNKKILESLIHLTPIPNARRSASFALRLYSKPIEQVSRMWANHLISTFDYLMYLNIKSGRSFNDYSQYPVFPWIISDYSGTTIPKTIRDLSKPMGQLDPSRAEHYDSMFENTGYFYGTHYSNPASVLHLLMRIEPCTLFNVVLHGGFDHPDRLFYSIQESWKSSSGLNPADVIELIPEMYSFPELLENINQINMPGRSDGINIDKVQLPIWANGDPNRFIYQMRSVLESPQVSSHINHWIDLIFGYKQIGQAAIEAKNLFHPLTYPDHEKKANDITSKAQVAAILHFGQCPQQLFQKEHIERSSKPRSSLWLMDTRITPLKKQVTNSVRLRCFDDEVLVCKKLTHFLASPPVFIKITKEGTISFNKNCLAIDHLFDVTDSAQSSDNLYLTVVTDNGLVANYYFKGGVSNLPQQTSNNDSILKAEVDFQPNSEEICSFGDSSLSKSGYFGYGNPMDDISAVFQGSYNHHYSSFILISRSLLPGTHFKTCAVSSHFGVVIAATDKIVYMFDLTSGFLLHRLETEEPITLIFFEEVQEFIILCTGNKLSIYTLDLIELTSCSVGFPGITSIATCDGVTWSSHPFFASGHKDGTVSLWEFLMTGEDEVSEPKLIRKQVGQVNSLPITSLRVIKNNKAIVAIDEEGFCCTITTEYLGKRVLKSSYFEQCAVCNQPFNTLIHAPSNETITKSPSSQGIRSSSSTGVMSNSSLVQPGSYSGNQNQVQIQPLICQFCGLPVCKRCSSTDKPNLCKICERLDETSIGPNTIDRTGSLNESDPKFDQFGSSESFNTSPKKRHEF